MAQALRAGHSVVVSIPTGPHSETGIAASCTCGWRSELTSADEARRQVEQHLAEQREALPARHLRT